MTFLIIPFCVASGTSAEIFEFVNDYDINASDIESADFNNDGFEDFVVTDWITNSSYYEVFLSNGDCSFTRPGAVLVSTDYVGQLLTGDFNEDSDEDLLLMSVDDTWLYFGDGTGNFTLEDTFPWSLYNGCTGDINNNGHLDIVGITTDSWVTPRGDSVVVMLGDGSGGFLQGWVYDDIQPSHYFHSAQLACLDIDINLDLCVNCNEDGFLVFDGIGDGSFSDPDCYETEIPGLPGPCFSTCGDFNEDGYTDIAVTGEASMSAYSTFIYLNQQDGTFELLPEGYFSGASDIEKMATADLDLDGHLDLSLAYGGGASIAGYGDGTFNGDWTEILSDKPWVDFVFIDMDLDEDLDLADRGGRVFRNITITQGCEEESSGSMTDLILNVSPNPFSAFVCIEVSGYSDGSENLQIFDLSGRLVAELELVSSGEIPAFHWDGVSSSGAELPSGIYTARLCSGKIITTVAVLKLK